MGGWEKTFWIRGGNKIGCYWKSESNMKLYVNVSFWYYGEAGDAVVAGKKPYFWSDRGDGRKGTCVLGPLEK